MLSGEGHEWVGGTHSEESQTHLHVDLDRERDSLLQLLRLLIEVLTELADGDSSLGWKNRDINMEK